MVFRIIGLIIKASQLADRQVIVLQVGRKGISIERTFQAVSDRAELETKVRHLTVSIRIVKGLPGSWQPAGHWQRVKKEGNKALPCCAT